MQLPDPVSVMQGFVDAVNRHEIDQVVRMFDEGATLKSEPALPRSPKQVYNGRGEIEKWLGALMAEHLEMTASNMKASGNKVTWNARISADRLDELGVGPVQAKVQSVLEGSLIKSIAFELAPESVQKLQRVTAAQPG
jgi:hypothetical protein